VESETGEAATKKKGCGHRGPPTLEEAGRDDIFLRGKEKEEEEDEICTAEGTGGQKKQMKRKP
jgi:hypothetical protein